MQRAACVRIQRRIEWIDTDAAGLYHWGTVCRFADAAEAALHTALGIEHRIFGATPRVAVRFDFRQGLRFNDPVDIALTVAAVGRTSVTYRIEVSGPDGPAVDGEITAVLVEPGSGRPAPWPVDVRLLLTDAGPQEAC